MAITFVAAGASSATNGSAPTPGLPAGLAANDLMLAVFYSRENVDGTVAISAGWTQLINDRTAGGLLGVWYRLFVAGDVAPTFTLTGHVSGTSGDSAIAQIAAWRGVDPTTPIDVQGAVSTNASIQNIGAISGLTLGANDAVVVIGGKRDDWTSVALLTGDGLAWAEIGEPDTTLGLDAGLVWDFAINGTSIVTLTSKTFTVIGGAAADGKGVMVSINVAPRRGQISWAELETPNAPRRGQVSWAEFETPDANTNRRGQISWAELETPNEPRRGRVSWAELDVPVLDRRGQLSWSELETPDVPTFTSYGLPFLYTSANWTKPFALEVYMRAITGMVFARLLNETDSVEVSGSVLSTTSTTFSRIRSGSLTLVNGKTYRLQFGKSTGTGEFLGGQLVVI